MNKYIDTHEFLAQIETDIAEGKLPCTVGNHMIRYVMQFAQPNEPQLKIGQRVYIVDFGVIVTAYEIIECSVDADGKYWYRAKGMFGEALFTEQAIGVNAWLTADEAKRSKAKWA